MITRKLIIGDAVGEMTFVSQVCDGCEDAHRIDKLAIAHMLMLLDDQIESLRGDDLNVEIFDECVQFKKDHDAHTFATAEECANALNDELDWQISVERS